jgi:pyrroloquinoline quinone biosynthesis protein D
MTAPRRRAMVSPRSTPSLPRHVRIRFDPVRQAHAVLSPERIFWPDDISLAILQRCDGKTSVEGIVDGLAAEYDAPREEVAADVGAFLQQWSNRLLVRL